MNLWSSFGLGNEMCRWTKDLSKNMNPNSLRVNLSGNMGVFTL